jgi:hypothetical protein
MAQQFDVPDKNAKKYQCFVCARQFLEFEEYTAHIINTHEEGREYIRCPLARCGTPVRDVPLHFKAKHPTEPRPQKGQMRAIIWKDLQGNGKLKTRKPKLKQGVYTSTKMQKDFIYRSGYESKVYELLDSDHDVLAYEAEPFKIPYVWKGEPHTYTPDILVRFVSGICELWEIKPADQTALDQNTAKWDSAERTCIARGWKFVVITEQEINKLNRKVQLQLNEGT